MKLRLFTLALLLISLNSFGQSRFDKSGYIKCLQEVQKVDGLVSGRIDDLTAIAKKREIKIEEYKRSLLLKVAIAADINLGAGGTLVEPFLCKEAYMDKAYEGLDSLDLESHAGILGQQSYDLSDSAIELEVDIEALTHSMSIKDFKSFKRRQSYLSEDTAALEKQLANHKIEMKLVSCDKFFE